MVYLFSHLPFQSVTESTTSPLPELFGFAKSQEVLNLQHFERAGLSIIQFTFLLFRTNI